MHDVFDPTSELHALVFRLALILRLRKRLRLRSPRIPGHCIVCELLASPRGGRERTVRQSHARGISEERPKNLNEHNADGMEFLTQTEQTQTEKKHTDSSPSLFACNLTF